MATLSACIRKAGKALDAGDADAIREIQREYLGDGLRTSEASQQALDDYLGILGEERADMLMQLNEQGGDITPYAGGSRVSIAEQERGDSLRQLRQEAERSANARETAAQGLRSQERDRLNQPKIRYGLNDEEITQVNEDPEAPDSASTKLGQTMEEMIRSPTDKSVIDKAKTAINDSSALDTAKIKGREVTLMAAATRNLVDFLPPQLKDLGDSINHLNNLMSGRAGELVNKAQKEVIEPWVKLHRKDPDMSGLLSGTAHRSTLARVDPSLKYTSLINVDKTKARIKSLNDALLTGAKRPGALKAELTRRRNSLLLDERRRSDHVILSKIFKDDFSQEARDVFTATRDMFDRQYKELEKSLIIRIDELSSDNKTKQALRAMVEKTFEGGRVSPYFPLARYGEYWAVAKDGPGSDAEILAYSQFEKKSEWETWQKNWKDQGAAVEGNRDTKMGRDGQGAKLAAVDPDFTLGVVSKLKGMETASSKEVNEVIDDIWQTYLQSLPEMSARKQFIHRKGVMGFTGDGLRAVADATLRNSRRIAKVEYQYKIENELNQLQEEVKGVSLEEDPWAIPTYDEMRQRHNWSMDHNSSGWSTALVALGFHNFLGFARASAGIVNLFQTPTVGLGTLSAFSLESKTAKPSASMALLKSTKDIALIAKFGRDVFSKDPGMKKQFTNIPVKEDGSGGGDVQALADIETKYSLYGNTRVHDLLGLREAGGDYTTSRRHQAAEISSWVFHNTEVFNRKVTSLAAYRMARQMGYKHDDAVWKAVKLTDDTHFDYSAQNRMRAMQNDAARVALQFRTYSFSMHYYVARNFNDKLASSEGTAVQKKQAARRFWGYMGMQSMTAGLSSLPFVWTLATVADMLIEYFDDDDEETLESLMDPQSRLRMYIKDTAGEEYGPEIAAIIMDGVVDGVPNAIRENTENELVKEYLPNPTVSTRLSLKNMALQDAPGNAPPGSAKWWAHYGGEALGPSAGLIVDWGIALNELDEGGVHAVGKALPAAIGDQIKAWNMKEEGVKTGRGATVVSAEELTTGDVISQFGGFAPYPVTKQRQENSARMYVKHRLDARRESLANSYIFAYRSGKDLTFITEKIDAHNKVHGTSHRINIGSLRRSESRVERSSLQGMAVSRREKERLQEIELTE